jgi:hypothetical protein
MMIFSPLFPHPTEVGKGINYSLRNLIVLYQSKPAWQSVLFLQTSAQGYVGAEKVFLSSIAPQKDVRGIVLIIEDILHGSR